MTLLNLVVNDNDNREVFTELISQRLSQNFQLIIIKASLPWFENIKIFSCFSQSLNIPSTFFSFRIQTNKYIIFRYVYMYTFLHLLLYHFYYFKSVLTINNNNCWGEFQLKEKEETTIMRL